MLLVLWKSTTLMMCRYTWWSNIFILIGSSNANYANGIMPIPIRELVAMCCHIVKHVYILILTSSGLNLTQYGTFLFVNLPIHWPKQTDRKD